MKKIQKMIKENKRLLFLAVTILLLFSISMLISYRKEWRQAMRQPWSIYTAEDQVQENYFLESSECATQELKVPSDSLTGVSVKFSCENLNSQTCLRVRFLNKTKDQLIKSWEFYPEKTFKGFLDFYFDEPCEIDRDDVYAIEVVVENKESGVVSLEKKKLTYPLLESNLQMDNEEKSQTGYSIRLLNGDCHALIYVFYLLLFLAAASVIVTVMVSIRKVSLETAFVVITLVLGGIYMFLIPPYAVPDEGSHIVTVYAESSKLLGKDAFEEETGKYIAEEDGAGYLVREDLPTKSAYVRYIKGIFGKTDPVLQGTMPVRTTLPVKAVAYIPQIIGVTVGRLIGCNAEQLMYWGRLFALLWYSFVMFWAIKLMPYRKMMLFLVGVFPMTMQQVVSFNYDSMLLGTCFFLTAYLLYLKFEKEKITYKDMIFLSIGLLIISMIKFIYLPIFGIVFLIPKEKFGNLKNKMLFFSGGVLAGIAGIAVTYISRSGQMSGVSESVERADGLMSYSFSYCLKNLPNTIEMFCRTLASEVSRYIEGMIASPLGWVDFTLPFMVVGGIVVLLLFCCFNGQEKYQFKKREKVWLFLLWGVMAFLVMLTMLLSYTYIGSDIIIGVQGRYFLPILLLFLLCIQNKKIVLEAKGIERYVPLTMVAIHTYIIWNVSTKIVCR